VVASLGSVNPTDGDSSQTVDPAQAPWAAPLAAVAIGSFPGSSAREPATVMAGETPDLPSIPELPGRGPGADMIGRTLGLLATIAPEFTADTTVSGWRLAGHVTGRATRVMRRAQSWLAEDVEMCEEAYAGAQRVKIAVAGPWAVAANLDLPSGHRVLSDPGATRDLCAAHVQMCADLVTRIRGVWPDVVVQLDEPALSAVLDAAITTPSGMDRYRAVSVEQATTALQRCVQAITEAGGSTVVHCCAVPAPVPLLSATGAAAISLDLTAQSVLGDAGHDETALGRVLESTTALVAGVVPVTEAGPSEHPHRSVERLMRLLDRIGVPLDDAAPRLAVSTPCGLAGLTPAGATAAVKTTAAVARILAREAGVGQPAEEER
jgi:methionine synthase II (cobalamin-independent)